MVGAAIVSGGFELGKLLIQAYMQAAKEKGLTEEQAKENFLKTYDEFMAVSAAPVEEVKP